MHVYEQGPTLHSASSARLKTNINQSIDHSEHSFSPAPNKTTDKNKNNNKQGKQVVDHTRALTE
jgi:hypothetical protein